MLQQITHIYHRLTHLCFTPRSPLFRIPPPLIPLLFPLALAANPDSLIAVQCQQAVRSQPDAALRSLQIAQTFLGQPYVSGTLEMGEAEQLVVNLHQFDCWTLVEHSVALALTADQDYAAYKNLLQNLRYWGGRIDGYPSRIHYFAGWILQAEKMGLLDDLTAKMGGVRYAKKFNYMSQRPQRYPALRNPAILKALQDAEARISRHTWYYIPQDKIARMENLIQDGDIVLLTSIKPGLDIAHEGFALRKNGRVYLLHASSLQKRVIVSPQPLAQYVVSQPGQTGIMVARLKPLHP
jgi:hypothetical protein